MSSIERAARVVKTLKDEEWKTLAALERVSMGQGAADAGRLARASRQPVDRVEFALERLELGGLVKRSGANFGPTVMAVEALGIREYVKHELVSALGAIIAKGKESDVYEAFDDYGATYALKFFKLGRTSFTRVRKKRFIDRSGVKSWMALNYEAARREYSTLRRLEGLSPSFPKALSSNRSTVLLEELSGVKLSNRPALETPMEVLGTILEAARVAYLSAGVVNGDLSEYNILTDGVKAWLIDWPQAVTTRHPNADDLLRHDVGSVVRFFARAYRTAVSGGKAVAFVTGGSESFA
jgi:RIO kinase 2